MMRALHLYLTVSVVCLVCSCSQQPAAFDSSPLPIPSIEEISANNDWEAVREYILNKIV